MKQRLARKTCSKEFRELVKSTFPRLSNNEAYWNFIAYIFYGTWRDEISGNLVISREQLAELSNKKPAFFNATAFLKAFNDDILKVTYKEATRTKARELTSVDIPHHIITALDTDRKLLAHEIGLVEFVSGKVVNNARKKHMRELDKHEALKTYALVGCQEAQELLEYMNSHSVRKFLNIDNSQYEEALATIQALDTTPQAKQRFVDMLRTAQVQPLPMYGATERSVRIYPRNDSILYLPKQVRATLTKGLVSLDLKSAQLAVISKTWNIPTLHTFLSDGNSVWQYFWNELAPKGDFNAFKAVVKKAIYSIVFGMSEDTLCFGKYVDGKLVEPGLIDTLKPFNVDYTQFFVPTLVTDILEARKRVYKQIKKDGGALDAFGKWITVTKEISERSVSAQVAQSYELKLLYPLVRAARVTDDFYIAYWLHDGVFVKVRNEYTLADWLEKLEYAVSTIAYELNIPTELEYNDLHT